MKKMATMLILLTLAVTGTAFAAEETKDFAGHQNETAIQYLYDNDVVQGYPDGTFKPDNELNRAELMKILVLGAGYDPSAEEYKNCFPDVTDEWFAPYICFAKEKGWVQGYPDGNFAPGVNINKVEAIKMLLETFKVEILSDSNNYYNDTEQGTWYFDYVTTAYDLGLLEEEAGTDYYPDMDIKRGQISENIYRLLMEEQEHFDIAAEKTELSEDFETAFSSCESGYNETIITLFGKMKYELVGMENNMCEFTVTVVEAVSELAIPEGTDMTCAFENTKTFKEMQEETNVGDVCEGPLTTYQ